jgi:hypothetical protein
MTVDECTRLLLDLALVDHVFGHSFQLEQRPENLLRAAKHYGVDVDQVRAEIDGERAAPATGVKGAAKGRAAPKVKAASKGKAKGEERWRRDRRADVREPGWPVRLWLWLQRVKSSET